MMEPHGDYKIELVSNIMHVYPTGGFNEQGIREMHKNIVLLAPKNKPWALFEHPKDIAGLTPESIDELVISYQYLSVINCRVVGLEISSTWQAVFEKSIVDKVNIPIYLSNDLEALEKLIKKKLNSIQS